MPDSKRTLFTLSVDARLLYERLIAVPIDGVILYSDLTNIVKRNVQAEAYGSLSSARNLAQRDKGIVFGVVRRVGLRRLNDVEIVGTSDEALASICRKARKGVKKLACVSDYAKLPDSAKARHNATMSVLAVVEHTAREQNVKRIEGSVANSGVPPLAETMRLTLKAFTDGGK